MPFVEGESLRDRLTRERQLPIDDAVRIAARGGRARSTTPTAHGVIHRDIKPENILLHDGQALVADFGIALAVSSAGGSRMTETGMSLGTPYYMSPEQAMGEREITAKSDVYALGCVLYEMLAGEPPFTGPVGAGDHRAGDDRGAALAHAAAQDDPAPRRGRGARPRWPSCRRTASRPPRSSPRRSSSRELPLLATPAYAGGIRGDGRPPLAALVLGGRWRWRSPWSALAALGLGACSSASAQPAEWRYISLGDSVVLPTTDLAVRAAPGRGQPRLQGQPPERIALDQAPRGARCYPDRRH